MSNRRREVRRPHQNRFLFKVRDYLEVYCPPKTTEIQKKKTPISKHDCPDESDLKIEILSYQSIRNVFFLKSLHFMKEKIKPRTIRRSIPKWIYYTTAVLRNPITWNSFFIFLHRTSLMGGKASDWGPWGRCSGQPVRKKSLGVLCSWSFLLAKAQSW